MQALGRVLEVWILRLVLLGFGTQPRGSRYPTIKDLGPKKAIIIMVSKP